MLRWSPWQPLRQSQAFTPLTLAETLDGGQAFRWSRPTGQDYWQGIHSKHMSRLRLGADNVLYASHPKERPDSRAALLHYLGHDQPWDERLDSLPWRSDAHLALCLHEFRGLRILQQALAETLLCFLCSATKRIPQIKLMCERLATELGSEIAPGHHALPTWEQLAASSEPQLRSLGLGFRAKNIKQTATLLASQPGLLDHIDAAPYAVAKAELTALPGVGEKIADCALLFGSAKLEAFPVDTWIQKVLQRRYQLEGWSPAQLSRFGRAHFGPFAGFAQQFLFSYERAFGQND